MEEQDRELLRRGPALFCVGGKPVRREQGKMKQLWEQGLGEKGEFAACHPLVNALFFFAAAGITMFSMSPAFLALSRAAALGYQLVLGGRRALAGYGWSSAVIVAVMCLVNGFFSHDGQTVLFYINSNRITVEGFLYGAWSGVMLAAVVAWFGCFGRVMTGNRIIYLFGRLAPVCGLVVSMIFRYIPLLRRRFEVIHAGQRCMGKTATGPVGKARQRVKEGSILVAWSLESSIESSDSMAARGYGLKGRTSFHLFRLSRRDVTLLAVMGALCLAMGVGIGLGCTDMYYYPVPVWPDWGRQAPWLICFGVFLALPFGIDLQGELKWKRYELNS